MLTESNMNQNTICLKSAYPAIPLATGLSYGGSQMWSDSATIRKCGCGIVAANDVLLYLQRKHQSLYSEMPDQETYCAQLKTLQHTCFPILYPSGINGLLMVHGLNKLFRKKSLPYHASLATKESLLISRIRTMLQNDIPVILSIGPNFPRLWEKNGIGLYRKPVESDCNPGFSCQTFSHYVVATAMENKWLTVSSWGRKYHISISEYHEFVRDHSSFLFSNVIKIDNINRRDTWSFRLCPCDNYHYLFRICVNRINTIKEAWLQYWILAGHQ